MTKINWNITDQELKQELVSSDNRWHISKTQFEDGLEIIEPNVDGIKTLLIDAGVKVKK